MEMVASEDGDGVAKLQNSSEDETKEIRWNAHEPNDDGSKQR